MSYRLSFNNGFVYHTEVHPTFEEARRKALSVLEEQDITLEEDSGDTILFLRHYCGARSWFETTIEQI